MKKRKQKPDMLTMWVSYAIQNGLSYGQCMAAVLDGRLPRPPFADERDNLSPTPAVKKLVEPDAVCIICGTPFRRSQPNNVLCGNPVCKAIRQKDLKQKRGERLKARIAQNMESEKP